MLKRVEIIKEEENQNPKFLKSKLITYKRDGDIDESNWEIVEAHDSVHVLIDNVESEELILVKQVRIPVLNNDSFGNGEVIEACAGLVDKDSSKVNIAKAEVLEETGYDCPIGRIYFLRKLKSSVGKIGSNCYTYIARVTDDMKVSDGGGLPEEDIELVRIPYDIVEKFFYQENHNTDSVTMFLITFWLFSKYKE